MSTTCACNTEAHAMYLKATVALHLFSVENLSLFQRDLRIGNIIWDLVVLFAIAFSPAPETRAKAFTDLT